MSHTLLIWEMVPEETRMYLIPNVVLTEEHIAFLNEAQGHMISGTDATDNNGLQFLNQALSDEEWVDGFEQYRGLFRKYEVPTDENNRLPALVNQTITRVYFAGFIL